MFGGSSVEWWSGGMLSLELFERDRNWQVEGQFNDSTDSGLEKR